MTHTTDSQQTISDSFDTLGLSLPILKAIAKLGYKSPTPIQKEAIPFILSGADLMAGSQTGTGKTAGFTLPLLHLLSERKVAHTEQAEQKQEKGGSYRPAYQKTVRALILAPTRELASQIAESVRAYGRELPLKSAVVFGGVAIGPQIAQIRKGVDILIATPGRLLDLINQRVLELSKVEILVMDEADRILDLGFINDIREIMRLIPKERQSLLFSATFSTEVKKLAAELLRDQPKMIQTTTDNSAAKTITQLVYPVDRHRKKELLVHLMREQNWQQAIIFTRTKAAADRLTEQLEAEGIAATAIHSNKSQAARMRALASFKRGQMQILVATDIAARGLDISDLPCVVNYELPNVPDDYVHRIGRTGRAGKEGKAISLVCVDERGFLRSIERFLNKDIEKVVEEGFAPNPSIRAEPIILGRGGGSRPSFGGARGGRSGGFAGRKPFQSREGFQGRSEGGFRDRDSAPRSFGGRPSFGDKPSYGSKPAFGGQERRSAPYPRREEGERAYSKPARSEGESRSFGSSSYERKEPRAPYPRRERSEGSSFAARPAYAQKESSYPKRREGGEFFTPRKAFGKEAFGRADRAPGFDKKPAGFKKSYRPFEKSAGSAFKKPFPKG